MDNLQHFMGYLDKGTSNGSLWVGVTLQPMKKFKDNFQILSTDYENYAILYTCTFLTTMYNQDDITILVRNSPAFEKLDIQIEEKVREEFDRLFGDQNQVKEEEDEIPQDDVFKTGEEKEQEEKPTEEDTDFLKEEGTAKINRKYGPRAAAKTNTLPL